MNKKIKISFDTGFSGGKLTINKLVLNVPFVIVQQNVITDGDYSLRKASPSHIACEYDGVSYSIGQTAEDYLLRSKKSETTNATMQGFYTMSRFETKEYSIMLKSLIAYALVKYEAYSSSSDDVETFKLSEIDDWTIYVGVSLPHSYADEFKYKIKEYLIGEDSSNPIKHSIKLTVGTDAEREISFAVDSHLVCNSQLKNAIINELLDENGNDVNNICDRANRPTLVLDGGYKTLGIGLVEVDMSVANATSNTDFAMLNINDAVSKQIAPYAEGYHDYMIDELVENNEVIRYLDNQTVKEINVSAVKKKEVEKAAGNLIEYLLDKFDNFLRIKSILIAGGTGLTYLPFIEEYCKENREYLADKIHVGTQNPENIFHGIIEKDGKFIETEINNPVYTCVLGLYKEMCAKLDN